MTDLLTLPVERPETRDESAHTSCTLHVCTSCRPSGTPREPRERRPGFLFFEALRDAVVDSPLRDHVEVRPAECLSICPRPCGFALSLPGSWTYLFGDQQPVKSTADVLECISLYLKAVDGFMPRNERPKDLRGAILGRVPPIKGVGTCI